MINIKKNYKRIFKKSAFTLVEVIIGLGISGITIIMMTKMSIDATKQAYINQVESEATVLSSKTSELLLRLVKLKQSYIPTDYANACALSASNPNQTTGTLYKDRFLFSDVGGNIDLVTTLPTNNTALAVPSLSGSPTLKFGQDNLLTADEKTAGYYRAVNLTYYPKYKVFSAQIVVFWKIYQNNNFYVTTTVFSINNLCG